MHGVLVGACQVRVNMGAEEHVKDWDATCMGVAGWVPVHVGIKLMEIEGTCSLTAAAHDAHRSWGVVAKLNCWF